MHEYEIRFLRGDRSTATILEVFHISDNAAIRQAKKLAEARPFEVWRGLDCVYGAPARESSLVPCAPPDRPAA